MGDTPTTMRSTTIFAITLAAALFAVTAAKSAAASHILVPDEAKCLEIKAKKHSTCPSGKSGGSLGTFGPGQMVPEFDKVVFSGDLKTVLGPIKTQFGHPLIWISERSE